MLLVPVTVALLVLAGQLLPKPVQGHSQGTSPFKELFAPGAAIAAVRADPAADRDKTAAMAGAQAALKAASERTAHNRRTPTPRVVCGMVVIPADPALDSGMTRLTPAPDVRYTIRSTPPPICR